MAVWTKEMRAKQAKVQAKRWTPARRLEQSKKVKAALAAKQAKTIYHTIDHPVEKLSRIEVAARGLRAALEEFQNASIDIASGIESLFSIK